MARQTVRELLVRITGDEAQLERSLNRSARSIDRVGRRVQGLGRGLTGFITAPAIAAGVALGRMINQASDYADEIDKTSIRTGIARDTLQELRFVADQTGVSFDGLTGVVESFTRRISQIDQGTSDTARSFQRLGVELRDRDGELRSMADLFPEIVGGLSRMENQTERNAIATQIFGRRAFEIVPILEAGGEQVEELMQRARDLGLVLGDESIQDLVRWKDEMSEVRQELGAVSQRAALAFLPVFRQSLIPFVREAIIPRLQDWAQTLQGVDAQTIRTVGSTVALVAAIPPLIWGIGSVIRTTASAIQVLGTLVTTKAALGSLLVPGGVLLAGLSLLAVGFTRARIEAAKAAIETAALRGEIAALSEEERQARIDRLTAEYGEAAIKASELRQEVGALTRELEEGGRRSLPGGPMVGGGIEGPSRVAIENRNRALQETQERMVEIGAELALLGQAERRNAQHTQRLEELQRDLAASMGDGAEGTRTAADVLQDLNEELRKAEEISALLEDETLANTRAASAYESALEELVSLGLVNTREEAAAVAAALLDLRGEMADNAAASQQAQEDEQIVSGLMQESQTAADRYARAVEALNAELDRGNISQERHNELLELARERYEATTEEGERYIEMLATAQALVAATITPAEELAQQEEALQLALEEGVITQEQYAAALELVQQRYQEASAGAGAFGSAVENTMERSLTSLTQFVTEGSAGISRWADSVIADIQRVIARFLILRVLMAAFPGSGFVSGLGQAWGFGGARAMGGPVERGRTYLVGERGPELFQPAAAGRIIPNHALASQGALTLRFDESSLPPRPDLMTPEALQTEDFWRRAYSHLKLDYDDRGGR